METPKIEVGLLNEKNISFFLHGHFQSRNSSDSFTGKFEVCWQPDGMIVKNANKEYHFMDEEIFYPSSIIYDLAEVENVRIGIDFHWDDRKNLKYQGSFKLIHGSDGIQLVNILPVENYLQSVIASEMSPHSSIALLKAHAVISRSWLLAQIFNTKEGNQHKHPNPDCGDHSVIRWQDREDHTAFHVCADDHCQRYYGLPEKVQPNVLKAIEETSGLVLRDGDKFCDTRYSKCCGGMTEKFESCWEPESKKYLQSIRDWLPGEGIVLNNLEKEEYAKNWIDEQPESFCNTRDEKILSQVLNRVDHPSRDFFRWSKTIAQEELSGLIRKKTGMDFGQIIDLVAEERGPSGRIIRLKIMGTKKSYTFGKELEIRRILSDTHLYSSAFYVLKEDLNGNVPGRFIIHGAGWGHGVGLCQIGAAVMGEMGFSYTEILMHYYKNVTLQNIY